MSDQTLPEQSNSRSSRSALAASVGVFSAPRTGRFVSNLGPEQGSVVISLWIDGEIHHSTTIDAAGWASVLAHCARAPHNGATYATAKVFHEAGGHEPGSRS